MEEKHIHIRAGKQSPATVADEGCDADPIWLGRAGGKLIPQLAYKQIDEVRALADRDLPVERLLESPMYLFRLDLIRVLRHRAIRQHWHRARVPDVMAAQSAATPRS